MIPTGLMPFARLFTDAITHNTQTEGNRVP